MIALRHVAVTIRPAFVERGRAKAAPARSVSPGSLSTLSDAVARMAPRPHRHRVVVKLSHPVSQTPQKNSASHRILPHVSCLRSAMSQTRADHASAERRLAYALALAALAFMASIPATGQPAKKPSAGLEGSWSGGGTVSFASGSVERARCRAHYRRAGSTSYTLDATCATASGRASQTASVRQVGENRYAGSFYNSEYGISGVISVVLHGRSQTVRLRSDSGSAVISLSR
jgi:hypothetical protein